nr:beta-(1,2)-xylosyltransferase [Tanacetum cinerariifolium]
ATVVVVDDLSDALRSLICEGGWIRMHPDTIRMLNGGEVSERMSRKWEDEELPSFAFGAFDFQVGLGNFVSLLILWTVFESVSWTRFVELTTLEHGWRVTTNKLAIFGDVTYVSLRTYNWHSADERNLTYVGLDYEKELETKNSEEKNYELPDEQVITIRRETLMHQDSFSAIYHWTRR